MGAWKGDIHWSCCGKDKGESTERSMLLEGGILGLTQCQGISQESTLMTPAKTPSISG